jgi:hypothetical protein
VSGGLGLANTLVPPPPFADAALKVFAVHIDRTPKQGWPGFGIYLGNGYVLTASHVIGRAAETRPHVVIDGQVLQTTVVREGKFEQDDLTLLRVDDTPLPMLLRLRHVTLCDTIPPLRSGVIVVTPEATARSVLARPLALGPALLNRFPTLIADVATTGNSGSGVFDARTQCLLGIMSRKLSIISQRTENGKSVPETRDVAKYFVSSDIIREALPPDVKF